MILLSVILGLETAALIVAVYYAVKFAMIVLKIQDSIENCIEILDERQESITRILTIPLFYDSPEVRKVLEDIKASRDSILYVANIVARVESTEETPGEES